MTAEWWYELDREDRITAVSPAWDEFAFENDTPSATAEHVIGRDIYSCVDGSPTRSLLQLIFDRIRSSGRAVELPFRCDAPEVRRFMTFTGEPTRDGGLLVRTRLLAEAERASLRFVGGESTGGRGPIRQCSWCNRFAVRPGHWVEAETAAEQLGLFLDGTVPVISHGLCPGCRTGVMGELSASDAA